MRIPKPNWTWYDYKLAFIDFVYTNGYTMHYDDKKIYLYPLSSSGLNTVILSKSKGWKRIYEEELKSIPSAL